MAASMATEACVYWIHCADHTDIMSEGYIGVTMYFDKRMQQHSRSPENPHLRFAIKKYGWDNLIKQKLVIGTPDYCLEVESKIRPGDEIGWNLMAGGGKPPDSTGLRFKRTSPVWNEGIRLSDETKKKISERVTNLWKDPEYRAEMCAKHAGKPSPMKGKKHSPETIEKIRMGKIGVPTGKKGTKLSAELRERLKEVARGHQWTCPHCGKSGCGKGASARWHFDNCRAKPEGLKE